MPPKKAVNGKAAPRKKGAAAKGYKLPEPIEFGLIATDIHKKQWKIGKSIGQGGFGEIYLASDNVKKAVDDNANFVVKIEPHSNGPLFTEMHCYMRIAKPSSIEAWKKEKKLKNLGMPKFIASGSLEHKSQKYRFMVMERFGSDLQKIIEKHKKQFSFKTVSIVACQILDVLEYIHHHDYIHADIKASNLLVGHRAGTENQVYLVDYGLACKYKSNGQHKEYKYDQRKAHDGTIEFTSRDAHIGAHSRRGDLEILGYNIIQWLCGKLPWEDKLSDCNYVATQKRAHMENIPKFMGKCFPDGIPPGVLEYMEYVSKLTFDEEPNYDKCRLILKNALTERGHKDDGKLVFMSATPKRSAKIPRPVVGAKKGRKRKSEEQENIGVTPKKVHCSEQRKPCTPRNFNSDKKLTRNTGTVKSPKFLSLSRCNELDVSITKVDSEDVIIEKENQKMEAKKKLQRPKRQVKKENTMNNPTPAMLEIMGKIREKSISPLLCTKKHRHNSNCYANRPAQVVDEEPTYLTPAMEEVLRNRARNLSESSEDSYAINSDAGSPQLFDSEDDMPNNSTVYYSPCGGDDCYMNNHSGKRKPRSCRQRKTRIPVRNNVRVTRRTARYSPEIP